MDKEKKRQQRLRREALMTEEQKRERNLMQKLRSQAIHRGFHLVIKKVNGGKHYYLRNRVFTSLEEALQFLAKQPTLGRF